MVELLQRNVTFGILALIVISIVIVTGLSTFTGFLTRTGQLSIGNTAPSVLYVYMNKLNATSNPNDVIINPLEASTRNVTVKVTVEELNGNCDEFTDNNGTAYLCEGVVTCDASNANHTITLVYNSTDGLWGAGNKFCNMSGDPEGVYYFEVNGTWTINVTVSDGQDTSTPSAKNWTYGELPAFSYASGGTVNMGVLNVQAWNNGTGQDSVNNTGNIVIDLAWNATNFTGQSSGGYINKTGTNYIIDDDSLSPDDTGNLPQQFINESDSVQVTFVPSSGLVRCNATECLNENATYDVFWHLYIPSGVVEDTYQNTIEIESTYH